MFFLFMFGFANSQKKPNNQIFKDIKYIYGYKNKKICKTFNKYFKKKKFTKDERLLITSLISDFDSRDFNDYDVYLDFFQFSNSLVNDKSDFLINWLHSLTNVVSDFSESDLEKILSNSNNFILKSTLSESEKFKWSFVGSFESLRGDTLKFNLDLDSLILSNDYHEIVIKNVKGIFDLRKNYFYAENGFIDGSRFRIDDDKILIKLFDYNIDLNSRLINVENAIVKNKRYFDLDFACNYSDYLSRLPKQKKFPIIESKQNNLQINFFNGFYCVAGIVINKDEFVIKDPLKPLNFFYDNEYLKLSFQSGDLKIKDSLFTSNYVKTKIFFNDNDSLYHPQMKFRFDEKYKNVYLRKYDYTYFKHAPILNSYHGLNIYSDFLRINFESNTAAFVHYPNKIDNKVLFESIDYFSDKRFNDLNYTESENLLSILIKFSKDYNLVNNIPVVFFTNKLNLNPQSVIDVLNTLEIFGFISLNNYYNNFDINKRAFDFFDSKNEKFDFDSFQIESSCLLEDTVSLIDFNNLEMKISNIKEIKITNQHNYQIELINNSICLYDDRSFFMNGNLRFGNFLFSAKKINFNYNDFSFHFPEKSTLNIYNNKLQRKNKLIQKIYFKESSIQLDSVNNKSGLETIYNFPRFSLSENNYVLFKNQDPKLTLDPLEITFLDEMAIQNLKFSGSMFFNETLNNIRGNIFLDPQNGLSFNGYVENLKINEILFCSGNAILNNSMFILQPANLNNSRFNFQADNIFINSKSVFSETINMAEFDSGIISSGCGFKYVYSDSIISFFSANPFSYNDFNFFGDLKFDFTKKNDNFFGKGKLSKNFLKINSNYFSFLKDSFISGNAFVSIEGTDGVNKFICNGGSIEWEKNNNSLIVYRGNLDFFLPKIQVYLNFDYADIDLNKNLIQFENEIYGKISNLNLKNNFECSINKLSYDYISDTSQFSLNEKIKSSDNYIIPSNDLIEINSLGYLSPFVANIIPYKKKSKRKILKNKLVVFDHEMKNFLIR